MESFEGKSLKEDIHISIKKKPGCEDIPLPTYMTENAAGMDIYAAVESDTIVLPGERILIPTGIFIALPEGYEAQVRPRSGLAIHRGVTLLNAPGTIDADYRGEIGVIIINHGQDPFVVKRRDRIAQIVVHKVYRVSWKESDNLETSSRGQGGFGHTDREI